MVEYVCAEQEIDEYNNEDEVEIIDSLVYESETKISGSSEGIDYNSRKESIKSDYNELAELSPLQTVGVISCLENIIDLLRLITFITPANCNDIWYNVITHKTVFERFGRVIHEKIFEDIQGPVPNTDLLKFKHDCCTFDTSLVLLLEEMVGIHRFSNLLNVVDDQLLMKTEETELLDELARNRFTFKTLQSALHDEEESFKKNAKMFEHDNFVLNQKLDDVQFETEITERFAIKYESERDNQNIMRLSMDTGELKQLVETSVKDYNNECRIHTEVSKYMNEFERDLEMSIVDWRNNYVEKIENLELLTIRTKANREEVLAQYEVLDKIYNQEKNDMETYLREKEERRLAAELLEKQKILIVKIQAWWRGIRARKLFMKMKAMLQKKGKKGAKMAGKEKGKGKGKGKGK